MGIKDFLQKYTQKYHKYRLLEFGLRRRKIRKLLITIKNTWPDIEEYPSHLDLYAILERVKKAWNMYERISVIKKNDFKYIPWILFLGDRPLLGESKLFYQQYSQHLISHPNPRNIIKLISSLLFYYPTDIPTFTSWLQLIEQFLNNYHKDFWRLKDWHERHSKWLIFKINSAKIIADKWLEQPIENLFSEIGISGKIDEYKFVHQVLQEILNNVNQKSKEGNCHYINHLISLLSRNNDLIHNEILKKSIIYSLLEPFINYEPPNEIKKVIIDYLLNNLGDLRLEIENWKGIDDTLVNVIKKWLSLESFNLFLDIIERTSDPRFYRRKQFWTHYFKQGYVTEAWAILGRKAEMEIFQNMTPNKNIRLQNFGLLINPDPRQSVLLLKIGDLIIAEWSHNGKCRIWQINNKYTPILYKKEYFASELRKEADYEKVHGGNWEYDIAQKIYEYTNVKHPILRNCHDTNS